MARENRQAVAKYIFAQKEEKQKPRKFEIEHKKKKRETRKNKLLGFGSDEKKETKDERNTQRQRKREGHT